MTNQRASATDELKPEKGMYGNPMPADPANKILQIQALARVGACATGSVVNIDLLENGYLGLFELIHQLCDEAHKGVDDLQHKAGTGIYSRSK